MSKAEVYRSLNSSTRRDYARTSRVRQVITYYFFESDVETGGYKRKQGVWEEERREGENRITYAKRRENFLRPVAQELTEELRIKNIDIGPDITVENILRYRSVIEERVSPELIKRRQVRGAGLLEAS